MATLWPDLKWHIIDTMNLVDHDLPGVVIGTALSTHIEGDPVWMYLSGPSGSGKTEILRALHGPLIKTYTGFTAQSLVSGFVKYDKETGEKKVSSILADLHNKVLVIRDASQLVCLPRDQLTKILGILRDAFDGGNIQGFGGPAGTVHIDSHFSCIIATTQMIEYAFEQSDKAFGERFLTFKPKMLGRAEHLEHALMMAGKMARRREEIQGMVANFLQVSMPPRNLDDIEVDIEDLGVIASFASAARSPVIRNKYRNDSVEAPPEVEYGARLAKQLLKLGKILFWMGENYQRVIKRFALSSIPTVRLQILKQVHDRKFCNIAQLKEKVNVSDRIVRQEADNLHYLGILDRMHQGGSAEEVEDLGKKRGKPKYLFSVNGDHAKGLSVMMGNKWMEPTDRELQELRQREERRARRHQPRVPKFIPAPDDFWPGEV
jgi:energy-coupling factor transporter ATP-binding protein EcfA2